MFTADMQKVLQSVAAQLMNEDSVTLDDQKLRVKRVGSGRLRMVQENREKGRALGRLNVTEKDVARISYEGLDLSYLYPKSPRARRDESEKVL